MAHVPRNSSGSLPLAGGAILRGSFVDSWRGGATEGSFIDSSETSTIPRRSTAGLLTADGGGRYPSCPAEAKSCSLAS